MQADLGAKGYRGSKASEAVLSTGTPGLAAFVAEPRAAEASGFAHVYRATPLERVNWIRAGIPAETLILTGEEMGVAKEKMLTLLHLTRATVNRRIKSKQALPAEYAERVIGLQKLIGQVEVMVAESGDPAGFNAAHWMADWLEQPVAALDNAKPADFMDTMEGQELVSALLAKMQSGAYA